MKERNHSFCAGAVCAGRKKRMIFVSAMEAGTVCCWVHIHFLYILISLEILPKSCKDIQKITLTYN
jgi:hypothetical protein